MPRKKTQAERRAFRARLKKLLLVGGLLLVCAGVLIGFWLLSEMGPRTVDYSELQGTRDVPESTLKLRGESREKEARFEEILALRDPTEEDLKILKAAIRLQREYIDALPDYSASANERLESLRSRYQNFAAKDMAERSQALEREAGELAEGSDFSDARTKYQEALTLQKRINERYPKSEARDLSRVTRLQREIRRLKAIPLARESRRLESEGKSLAEKGEWEAAEAKLREAIELQETINRKYQGTPQSSGSRLETLKVDLVAARSGEKHETIQGLAERAEKLRENGENLEAANLWQEATRLQKELNDAHRESPHASAERLAKFRRKSQTARSFELGRDIERQHERLRKLLARRKTYEAAELITDLRHDIRQMAEAYPRSSLNDKDLQVKLRYLNLVQGDLGFIQDRIYDALLAIPEIDDWKMLRTEVTQALYSLIMGTNPSRNRGDVKPVDSVSWEESQEFAERLSWILGKPVRLPTENEFRQALGRLRYLEIEKYAWAVANSDGKTHPVGEKKAFESGFHDLLGNVSEWLESVDKFEDEDAKHIGGHAQDTVETIFTVPVRETARNERSRMIGFRVAVNTG